MHLVTWNMIFICNTFILLLCGIHNAKSLKSIDQDGVCTKTTISENPNYGTDKVTKIFCCRHYEKQNNQCIVCKLGYTSYSGKPCQPCVAGYYGARCAFVCKCEASERCHHVRGCISELGVTRTPSSVYTITEEDQSKTFNVITKQQLLLYIVSAACFVLLIGVCFLGWKYKKKSQSRKVPLSTTDHDTNDKKDLDLNPVNHNTVTRFESAYDEIDESCIINSLTTLHITKPTTNTNIFDESVFLKQRNITEQNSVSSHYLTPISGTDENEDSCDIQDTSKIIVMETPECCGRPHSAMSDYLIPVNAYQDSYVTSHVNDSNSEGDDYLHPYTSVISSLQRDTITADIHTENQISSASDEEANDHKYSHLYEQLSHDCKDNCSSYQHLLSPQHSITYGSAEKVCIQNTKVSNTFQKYENGHKRISGFNEMKTSSQKVSLSVLERNITEECLHFDKNEKQISNEADVLKINVDKFSEVDKTNAFDHLE